MFPSELITRAEKLLADCREHGLKIATAESCTGGLIAALLTEIAGSSDVFERGFVTYSNAAKQDMLGVKPETLDKFGAVSTEVAGEMATSALARSRAHIAISVTGIAGPGGGTTEKPVGLVCFGLAKKGAPVATSEQRFGNPGRNDIRMATVEHAIELLEGTL